MSFKPTPQQQQVIDSRNEDLLVSAAAGSGKTAVLVERILDLICDTNVSIDIDRILIVTFTKAAAAEMRERIFQAIEKRLESSPEDNNLKRQMSLVHFASISTIDSFCSWVLREYFNEVGVSPDFKVMDDNELSLIENNILEELLSECFENGQEDFLTLCDCFSKRESIQPLKEVILSIYKASQNDPYPMEWLKRQGRAYSVGSIEELKKEPWFIANNQAIRLACTEVLKEYEKNIDIIDSQMRTSDGSPHPYMDMFLSDSAQLKNALEVFDEDELEFLDRIASIDFIKLSPKKLDEEDVELRNKIKDTRNTLKKELNKQSEYIISNPKLFVEKFTEMKPVVDTLFEIILEYSKRLLKAKYEASSFSFSDIEHLALNVLRDENSHEITDIGKNLSEYYEYIMVDEYQDSNLLQEAILTSIAKTEAGNHNYFMVGDVKQSIYRFRKAKPSLFIEKYDAYKKGCEDSKVIDLSNNFRSRNAVTNPVNQVFFQIMKRDIGGIEYDDAAKLVSANPILQDDTREHETELLIMQSDHEVFKDAYISADYAEALLIANKIKDIVGKMTVYDDGDSRPATYSDIAIIHRSANSVSPLYVEALRNAGIPVKSSSAKGYFNSYEIESLLAMIALLNNPYDDISLVNVLKNFYGFSKDDLAIVRANAQEDSQFYSRAFFNYANTENASEKVKAFCDSFSKLQQEIQRMRLYEIIRRIIRINDFKDKIQAMPGGDIRLINIEKLINMAISFESINAKGLHDFVNYIRDIEKYDINFDGNIADTKDCVSLMTIHKSKGLEYPICIVAGMCKKFKAVQSKNGIIVSDAYGVGLDYIDGKNNITTPTKYKEILRRFESVDEIAENQRLLYVAMTRAKEKLILTGVCKESDLEKYLDNPSGKALFYSSRLNAGCFLDWVLPVYAKNGFTVSNIAPLSLVDSLVIEKVVEKEKEADIDSIDADTTKEEIEVFKEKIEYKYPIEAALKIKSKYSVSEIKQRHMENDSELIRGIEENDKEFKKRIPCFKPDYMDEKNMAAIRGTAVHRFMECVNLLLEPMDINSEIDRMLSKGLLSTEEADTLDKKLLEGFFESNLCKRMKEAAKRGQLFKEKTFIASLKSKELFPELDFCELEAEDTTLIQGIIDAYFIEDGKIVVLDYKTDKVNNETVLKKRYKAQLDMYSDAINRASNLLVSEKIIYSFELKKEIAI